MLRALTHYLYSIYHTPVCISIDETPTAMHKEELQGGRRTTWTSIVVQEADNTVVVEEVVKVIVYISRK